MPTLSDAGRYAFRIGLAPLLSTPSLLALARALEADDPRLVQGVTTVPPPLASQAECPCAGACLLAFTGLVEGLETVGEVEEFWSRLCHQVDVSLGREGGCRDLMEAWDELPRAEARAEFAAEVRRMLTLRRRMEAGRPGVCAG